MIHDRDIWTLDRRRILSAFPFAADDPCANSTALRASEGWSFERFERNGEMASIPYLRATKDGESIEAPLRNFAWVRFEETPK